MTCYTSGRPPVSPRSCNKVMIPVPSRCPALLQHLDKPRGLSSSHPMTSDASQTLDANSMPPPTLPVVDISPFILSYSSDSCSSNSHSGVKESTADAQAACVSALADACSTYGFFYLTGHGIPDKTLSRVLELARSFFLENSDAEKDKIRRREPGDGAGDGARGYQRIGENVTGGRRDWHEAIDLYAEWDEADSSSSSFSTSGDSSVNAGARSSSSSSPPYSLLRGRNPWPDKPAEIKEFYGQYIEQVKGVGTAVVRAMGHALGLDPQTDSLGGGENTEVFVNNTRKSFWVMRMIGYPPLPGTEKKAKRESSEGELTRDEDEEKADDDVEEAAQFSCGAHTDYGCVTLLLTDSTRGALQVQLKDGSWINADPIPGAFVVNIGDMMERWTNGIWKSTLHRVIHRGDRYRVSVPFFFEPDWDAKVKPLEKCVQDSGGAEKFDEVKYGDHLVMKVTGNFY